MYREILMPRIISTKSEGTMKSMNKILVTTAMAAMTAALAAVGCAAPAPVDSATPEESELSAEATIYSSNADGTWSATAYAPAQESTEIAKASGVATFTGPWGKTRKMGVCMLKRDGAACSTVADCAGIAVPTGGARYCTQAEGDTSKRCWIRPGPSTSYCAGSPALGGAAVSSGTYTTPQAGGRSTTWLSYACFEGCSATDPSVSSSATLIFSPLKCGSVYC